MDIQFDPAKNERNLAKHGVSLALGAEIFVDDEHLLLPSARPIDGENRYKIVGAVDGRVYTGIHVYRGDAVRFISVRRSNHGEERLYWRA